MKRVLPLLWLLASCAEPGKEVRPIEGEFAFVEMNLGS